MNGYKAFFNGRTKDIHAHSRLAAHEQAVAAFKAPKSKRHMVSVILCELNGAQVTHSTAAFG